MAARQREHDMDVWTDYCRHCGASAIASVDRRALDCHQPAGEIAVMHILAAARLRALIDPILGRLGF